MAITNAAELAHALGAKRVGSEYLYACPAHADRVKSLTFTDGDKVPVVLTCHAGCTHEEIRTQMLYQHGIDLAPPPVDPAKPRIICVDQYQDWDGTILYEKVRYEPKGFKLRKDKDTWTMRGVKEVIFRLPQLKKAINSGATIFIVEGEKDVKNLESLGLVATCNTHGASKDSAKPKWNSLHARYLLGAKDVVILPDNDDAGKAHARAVAESLVKLGIPCKIVELPELAEKEDVSDWIARDGTKESLLELAAAVSNKDSEWTNPCKSGGELMEQNLKPINWTITYLLPEGFALLAAPPKSCKSWLALDLWVAVATGGCIFGDHRAEMGKALYLALEDSEIRLQNRMRQITQEGQWKNNEKLLYQTAWPNMANGGLETLARVIKEDPAIKLVIIDTLAKFLPPQEKSGNVYRSDYIEAGGLQKFALDHHITLLAVTHTKKASTGDAVSDVTGSFGVAGSADTIWSIRKRDENSGTITITGRDVYDNKFEAQFDQDSCRWKLLGTPAEAARKKNLVIIAAALNDSAFTSLQAQQIWNVSQQHANRMINDLVMGGYAERMTEKAGRAYQFKLTDKMAGLFMDNLADDPEYC